MNDTIIVDAQRVGRMFAMPAGPRGPSTIMPALHPEAFTSSIMARNASAPPRLLDPRALRRPKRAIVCAMRSPSRLALTMTTPSRSRKCIGR